MLAPSTFVTVHGPVVGLVEVTTLPRSSTATHSDPEGSQDTPLIPCDGSAAVADQALADQQGPHFFAEDLESVDGLSLIRANQRRRGKKDEADQRCRDECFHEDDCRREGRSPSTHYNESEPFHLRRRVSSREEGEFLWMKC